MRRSWTGLLAILSLGTASAQNSLQVDDRILEAIRARETPTTPHGPGTDRRNPLQAPRAATPPPDGVVQSPAEYQDNNGLLIRWGTQQTALLTEMTVAITNGDPAAIVYIVVSGTTQQNSATSTLGGAGADLSQVRFITAPSDSIWIRDYGPRTITVNGLRAFMDHTYNRNRPQDDGIPGFVAPFFSQPLYDNGLVHGGGNFHLFDDGRAYMTRLIVNENPGLSETTIVQRYRDYQGLDVRLTDPFPATFDSTQHIDMWMLPLARRKVLLSQYPTSTGNPATGEPNRITEALAIQMAAEGYQVYRTPGWGSSTRVHYTYANAVLLNKVALVCRFDGFETQNAQALAVFREALPERTVVPVNCSSIISSAGAIHCIVMHVAKAPAEPLLRDGFE